MLPRTLRVMMLACIMSFNCAQALQATDGNQRQERYMLTKRVPAEYQAHPAGDLVCRPFGECAPCPEDERDQPFCQPFGNRRLLHCLPSAEKHSHLPSSSTKEADGEVPAWEACGKVVAKERADYWEFVTANLLFLLLALAILAIRSSSLAAAQYRQLAAKIGIPAGVGGSGWRG